MCSSPKLYTTLPSSVNANLIPTGCLRFSIYPDHFRSQVSHHVYVINSHCYNYDELYSIDEHSSDKQILISSKQFEIQLVKHSHKHLYHNVGAVLDPHNSEVVMHNLKTCCDFILHILTRQGSISQKHHHLPLLVIYPSPIDIFTSSSPQIDLACC